MKKLILSIIILLFAGQGWGADQVDFPDIYVDINDDSTNLITNPYLAANITSWGTSGFDNCDPCDETFEWVASWKGKTGVAHVWVDGGGEGVKTALFSVTTGVSYRLEVEVWVVSGSVTVNDIYSRIGTITYTTTTTGHWERIVMSDVGASDGNESIGFASGGGTSEWYINMASAKVLPVGSEADPYNDLSDINWTTGGDNSIFDYLDGTPDANVTINLAKDGEWREEMTVAASGTATYRIIIGSYGSGDDPIINGADELLGWADEGNNI